MGQAKNETPPAKDITFPPPIYLGMARPISSPLLVLIAFKTCSIKKKHEVLKALTLKNSSIEAARSKLLQQNVCGATQIHFHATFILCATGSQRRSELASQTLFTEMRISYTYMNTLAPAKIDSPMLA